MRGRAGQGAAQGRRAHLAGLAGLSGLALAGARPEAARAGVVLEQAPTKKVFQRAKPDPAAPKPPPGAAPRFLPPLPAPFPRARPAGPRAGPRPAPGSDEAGEGHGSGGLRAALPRLASPRLASPRPVGLTDWDPLPPSRPLPPAPPAAKKAGAGLSLPSGPSIGNPLSGAGASLAPIVGSVVGVAGIAAGFKALDPAAIDFIVGGDGLAKDVGGYIGGEAEMKRDGGYFGLDNPLSYENKKAGGVKRAAPKKKAAPAADPGIGGFGSGFKLPGRR